MPANGDNSPAELRSRLDGGLYEPGAPEYDDACTLFNAMIERSPHFVARCASPEEGEEAMRAIREFGPPAADFFKDVFRAVGHVPPAVDAATA
jgi:hypothetical protein